MSSARPFVILLSGPSGAGKTVTAAAWAAAQPVTTAVISHDQVRGLIRSGFASPESGLDTESAVQWELAIDVCSVMVGRYLDGGVRCAVDVYRPPQPHDRWDDALAALDVRPVVLMPNYDVARMRNTTRDGHRVTEEDHRRNYENFEWCVKKYRPPTVIDNSVLTIAETVAAIDDCLAEGAHIS